MPDLEYDNFARQDSPEMESVHETPLFDLDAMTDDEIIVTHRAITQLANAGPRSSDGFDAQFISDSLGDRLSRQVVELGARAPERVKAILARCLRSDLESDGELIPPAAAGIVSSNYELARDSLISYLVRPEVTYAPEIARGFASDMMRDSMTPEQVADFNSRYLAAGGYVALQPSRTEEEQAKWIGQIRSIQP